MKFSAIYLLFPALALMPSLVAAQYQEPNYSSPTIQRVDPRANHALPPLPHNAPPANEPSNAKWLGNPRANEPVNQSNAAQVVPASAIAPVRGQNDSAGSTVSNAPSRLRLNPPSEKRSTSEASGSTLQMLLSVGSSLMIVLGLFLGFAWFYRKTMNNPFASLPKSVVKVLGRTNLAPRQQLMVVRFGSKLVLVSLVQGEARTLSEITDPLEVDVLAGMCESHQPNIGQSFRSILNPADRGVA